MPAALSLDDSFHPFSTDCGAALLKKRKESGWGYELHKFVGVQREQVLAIACDEIACPAENRILQYQIVGMVTGNDPELTSGLYEVGRFKNSLDQELGVLAAEMKSIEKISLVLFQDHRRENQIELTI